MAPSYQIYVQMLLVLSSSMSIGLTVIFHMHIFVVGHPPFRSVWPKYEVFEFKPWSGTTLYLGSVDVVASYLVPAPLLSTVFWVILFPHVLHPSTPLSATVQLSFTILLRPIIPLSSGLGSTYPLDISSSRRLPPPVPSLFFLSALDLLYSVPLVPWIPVSRAYFCRLCPRLFYPPSLSALNMVSVPVGPSGFSLLRVYPYASIAPVLSPPLSPSTCLPAPLLVPRSFLLLVSGYPVLLNVCYRLYRPCGALSLGVLWCLLMIGLFFFGCPFAWWQEARAPPLTGNISPQPLPTRYSYMPTLFRMQDMGKKYDPENGWQQWGGD